MARVSIGLPVYNGENFVAAAVESLLAQTFTDFELVISDNCSTDATSEICRSFAARDKRVRYHRNETNIGGGPNVNQVFRLANAAPYYKWAAHDDVHAPTFLERCVAALDADPGAVLANSKVELVDPQGKTLRARQFDLAPLASPDPVVRFQALVPGYDCLEMYSVMRREALVGKDVPGLYADCDSILMARLALRGRFVEVPEVLFFNRRHEVQAGARFDHNPRAWAVWWNPEFAHRRIFPQWRRQAELWRAVLQAPLSPRDRMRCALLLARWAKWKKDFLYQDVAYHVKDILRLDAASKSGDAPSH
jgi:glycosyltransferase involved in cell wall biosynthesis